MRCLAMVLTLSSIVGSSLFVYGWFFLNEMLCASAELRSHLTSQKNFY